MSTKNLVAVAVGVLITLTLFGQDSAQESKEKAAKAAETWLMMLDSGQYTASWKSSSTLVKDVVSEDQWVQLMESARKTFGNPIKRTLKSREYATSLPGAPDGHYVIIQYESSFEKKKSAVETVTPMLDSDGQWRVSGYNIK